MNSKMKSRSRKQKVMKKFMLLSLMALCLHATPAVADDKAAVPEAGVAAAAGDDYPQRLELAKKMHEFSPASAQVKSALEQAALKLPERDRETFISRMTAVID